MMLKCYNQKCLYEWYYKGRITDDKGNITCPKCWYKLRLGKAKMRLPNLPNKQQVSLSEKHLIHNQETRGSTPLPAIKKQIQTPQEKERVPNYGELADFIGETNMKTGRSLPYEELADVIAGTNMKDGKAPTYEELASEINGVKMKD